MTFKELVNERNPRSRAEWGRTMAEGVMKLDGAEATENLRNYMVENSPLTEAEINELGAAAANVRLLADFTGQDPWNELCRRL